MLGPVTPLSDIDSLAKLWVHMGLLGSRRSLSHLSEPILHVKLAYIQDAFPCLVLISSGSTSCHTTLCPPLIGHLNGRE